MDALRHDIEKKKILEEIETYNGLIKLAYRLGEKNIENDPIYKEAGLTYDDNDIILRGLDILKSRIENIYGDVMYQKEFEFESTLKDYIG
jgi:hypothetical protein